MNTNSPSHFPSTLYYEYEGRNVETRYLTDAIAVPGSDTVNYYTVFVQNNAHEYEMIIDADVTPAERTLILYAANAQLEPYHDSRIYERIVVGIWFSTRQYVIVDETYYIRKDIKSAVSGWSAAQQPDGVKVMHRVRYVLDQDSSCLNPLDDEESITLHYINDDDYVSGNSGSNCKDLSDYAVSVAFDAYRDHEGMSSLAYPEIIDLVRDGIVDKREASGLLRNLVYYLYEEQESFDLSEVPDDPEERDEFFEDHHQDSRIIYEIVRAMENGEEHRLVDNPAFVDDLVSQVLDHSSIDLSIETLIKEASGTDYCFDDLVGYVNRLLRPPYCVALPVFLSYDSLRLGSLGEPAYQPDDRRYAGMIHITMKRCREWFVLKDEAPLDAEQLGTLAGAMKNLVERYNMWMSGEVYYLEMERAFYGQHEIYDYDSEQEMAEYLDWTTDESICGFYGSDPYDSGAYDHLYAEYQAVVDEDGFVD